MEGCVEREDLERLLAEAGTGLDPPVRTSGESSQMVSASGTELTAISAELESWVAYAPRALALLADLEQRTDVNVAALRATKLGITVKRYATGHSDAEVAKRATALVAAWKERFITKSGTPQSTRPVAPQAAETLPSASSRGLSGGRKRVVADDDDSSAERSDDASAGAVPSRDVVTVDDEDDLGAGDGGEAEARGWVERRQKQSFRGRDECFRVFTLLRPFRCTKWRLTVRIAEGHHQEECKELLDRMAREFGASSAPDGEVVEGSEHVVRRLQRLEERFRGNGVTEGEARNAVRLFERELSRANWTEEKFAQLKRQLEGTEEWSAADVVAETAVRWTEQGRRRQAWFSDACERIAAPLGLESGYTPNGGCCFVGPLSAAAGATLTMALVCHLGDLDLACSTSRGRGGRGGGAGRSRLSEPQFMQGFVDGALSKERHIVWEKLFSIEDEAEATRYCEESLRSGFFEGGGGAPRADSGSGPASRSNEDNEAANDDDNEADNDSHNDGGEDIQSMLRGLFAVQPGMPSGRGSLGTHATRGRGRGAAPNPVLPTPQPQGAPPSFKPFSGKHFRLGGEDDGNDSSARPSSGGQGQGWALTFASNLNLARSSRRRSKEEAKKTYHWSFAGHAVKATPTGTASYSQGRQAGEQRKAQIDGVTQSARRKFQRTPRLAIER